MINQLSKRLLSFVLVLVMLVSMLPVSVFAEDVVDYESEVMEEPVSEVPETEETEVEVDETGLFQARIDAILDRFSITEDLTYDELVDRAINGDEEALELTMEELPLLEADAEALTEEEFNALKRLDIFGEFVSILNELYNPQTIANTTVAVLDGQVSITDNQGTGSVSDGTVTITVTGGNLTSTTNKITVTNTTNNKAELSFDYTAYTYNSFTVAGSSANATGSYSGWLEGNSSIKIEIKAAKKTTATLTLSNFSLVAAAESSNVTFHYDTAGGSVTVGGTAVLDGDSQNISLTDGTELVANAKDGYTFLGWINEEHQILSEEATYTLKPAKDMTVTAVFAKDGGTPWFALGTATKKSESIGLLNMTKRYYYTVGQSYLYNDLNTAVEAAEADGAAKTLVLMNNATLSAGDYTIPSGVTLLIPFDGDNTLYTTEAVSVLYSEYKTPTAYRTLTMADGANLTVNGAVSLSAKHTSAHGGNVYGGTPTGNVSFVTMQGNSNITVNNGGALYAYGYITGSGSVTANSGATVYELFQFTDFRGGSQTTDMENGVFPLSQYYIQNIEVPLTIYSGATEYAYTSIYMSSTTFGSAVGFIAGSGAMFSLTNGYVVKTYDGTTDRLILEGYGDLAISSIKMSVGASSIDSSKYDLGINNNLSVKIQTGTITINQDLALLPGAEITVAEGAKCVLGSGTNLYIYDNEQWGGYCGSSDKKLIPLTYAPGKTYTRTEANLVDAKVEINGTVDATAGYIYTTAGGANICGTGTITMRPGTQTVTYQLRQTASTYDEIPLTSAKLKNSDGSYVETSAYAYGEYTCTNGVWTGKCMHKNTETVAAVAATCTADGYTEGVKCTDCGAYTSGHEVISATDHSWNDGEVSTAATCTTAGVKTLTCTVCNETKTETIAATGHSYNDVVTDPTCTAQGYTTHTCSCGYSYKDNYTDALKHSWNDGEVTTAATCTKAGEKTFTCSTCGETKTETIAATGHTEATENQKAATCTEEGYTGDVICSVCQTTIKPGETIAKLAHSWNGGEVTKAATCKEAGVKTFTCTVCEETKTEEIEKDPNNHVGGTEVRGQKDPTCTEKGYTGDTYCLDCEVMLKEGTEIAAKGHTETIENQKAATCTEKGYTGDKVCSDCDETLETGTEIAALDHSWNDGEVTTAATCTTAGVKTFTCTREGCGEKKTEDIAATGHQNTTTINVTAATCTEKGYTGDTYCKDCNTTIATGEDIAATGHKNTTTINYTAATCTVDGYTGDTYCTVCGNKTDAGTAIPATGHQHTELQNAKKATCTEDGYTGNTYCTDCQTVIAYGTTIANTGHSYTSKVTKEPTCTEKGERTYTCGTCGHTYTAAIADTGHSYTAVVTEPTCTAQGYTTHTCACGASYVDSYEDALGHEEGPKATCTADQICIRCNEVLVEKTGHKYTAVETLPTCVREGYTTYTCTNCEDSYTGNELPALKHKLEDVVTAPTCTEKGYTTHTCTRDGCSYSSTDNEKPALEHDYETVVTDPTCTEGGYTTHTCTRDGCSYSYTSDETAKLGHDYKKDVTAPTCTEQGHTTYTCTREGCTHSYVGDYKSATNHSYTPVVTAPTCTAQGYTTYTCHCGDRYVSDYVDATGHTYDAVVTAPTCTEEGYTTYTCHCGYSYVGDKVPAKGHTRYGAACDEEAECSVCGEQLPANAEHTYQETVYETTCTSDGYTVYTCTACGHTYTENGEKATGHSYTDVVTAPTCTEKGYTTHTCSKCSDSYVDSYVDAKGHDCTDDVTLPTCTKQGYTTHFCKDCDYKLVDTYVSATGHSMSEATCTEPATCQNENCDYTEGEAKGHTPGAAATCTTDQICTICETVIVASTGHNMKAATCTEPEKCENCDHTEGEALGHSWDDGTVTKAATCTVDGVMTHHCTREGCSETKTEAITATGHPQTKNVDAKDATCEEAGYTGDYVCTECGTTVTPGTTIPKLGHEWDSGEVTTKPTCTETGVMTYHCTRAGCEGTKTETIKATGHSYTEVVTKPTCTAQGYTTHTCSNCGDSYKDTYTNATGHSWGDGEVTKAATCTETGVKTYTCSTCNGTKTDTIAATGHQHTKIINAKTANCHEAGYTGDTWCEDCQKVIKSGTKTSVNTAKHDGETEVRDAKTATCCATGYTGDTYCTGCNTKIASGTATAKDTANHVGDTEIRDAKTANCHETGYTGDTYCLGCGEKIKTGEETAVDSNNHAGGTEVRGDYAATCTKAGYTGDTCCKGCDTVLQKGTVIPAKDHTPGAEATCTENQTCTVCGDVLVKATGHSYTSEVTNPTCAKKGYTTYTCHCGHSYVDDYVDATGHSYNDVVTAPTCTEKGYTTHSCKNCTYSYKSDYVDATGHDYTDVVTEPTCTEGGYTTHTCGNCGDTYTDTEVAAKGHDCTEVVTAPTCTEKGYTTHSCKNCDYVLVDTEVKALGHDLIAEEELAVTCTTDGHTEGSYCSRCDYVTWTVIEATGHTWVDVDAKNPTYTNVGWEAYQQCSVCKAKQGYVEIPVLDEPVIDNYEDFVTNLALLEELAHLYVLENPGKDPVNLVIKYIRTGVERYNSGSWGIMAGYEDAGFAKYVSKMVDEINSTAESEDELLRVVGLKNLENFTLPNGDEVDFGHMFGTMDITYHNSGSQNHADVAGWAGDLVDLMGAAENYGVDQDGDFETLVQEIRDNVLCQDVQASDQFSEQDMIGDLDGLYVMTQLASVDYEVGSLTAILEAYFTEELSMKDRADYYLRNRLDGASLRSDVRTAVYNAFTGNKLIATLEGTREFETEDLTTLRKACCYAFADYVCELAGDYVDNVVNNYYSVFSSTGTTLAPGITQQIKYATSADGKQMAYYIATADITRSDVQVYANYNNNDPASGWAMQRVLDQANAAQDKYGDPDSEYYIENYNVIASINASGYNMSTGEPGGLLVMGGVEYHAISSNGFFGILKDGTAVIGTTEEYNTIYKDQVQEGVEIFGTTLIKDGKICVTASSDYYTSRASRTAVGITATGKVVMMVLDGRQEPFSCGGSMEEIAQIMFEAGCVQAVNLDGGGSTTYVAKQPGEDSLEVVNSPSDGAARSVSSTLMIVSTAPSSTAFDHASVKADYNYMTFGASVNLTATGISATGDAAEIPEGAYWTVSDEAVATVSEDGVVTAGSRIGGVTVSLMLEDTVVGSVTLEVVNPDNVYFTKTSINAVYGQSVELPVKVLYEGKEVAVTESDLIFTCNSDYGSVSGFKFTASTDATVKSMKVTAALACNEDVTASITVALYNQGEVSFDFDQATGGDRQMAWDRVVTNATTEDEVTYEVIDIDSPMVTNYTFAIDMSEIPIPEKLSDLIYMLPGADAADASAWGFLLQLAERISDLSEVKPVITFDPNVEVDYSELKIVNDYFTLTDTEFDEETNSLTLTLNWIKQSAAIDPDTANSMCIVSGIKLTPKDDAQWNAQNSLTLETVGTISYKIYMRANALYSFAQKEENQETYGLLPYVNPNNETDKGGWFGDVYCTFNDSYTLVNKLKSGWVVENGGYAYYVEGEKLTGVQQAEGYYYDFGESGINVGKTKYNGVFFDEADSVYRYAYLGELASGWQSVDGEWYYFSGSTMAAVSGTKQMGGVYYEFEDNGRLKSGVWVNTLKGVRYYTGPSYHWSRWLEVDGEMYYFESGYRITGYHKVPSIDNKHVWQWYNFGEDGIARDVEDGLLEIDGQLYYMIDGINQVGLQQVDGDYYFFTYDGPAVCGQSYYAWETHCDLPCSTYAFGADGKMVNGLAEMSDGVYYYVNGKVVTNAAGLTKIGDDYYFVSTKGRVATGKYYCWATNCELPCGNYEFASDGKMLSGIVEKEDGVYFYVNGKVSGSNAGLTKIGDDYYFVSTKGRCATGSYYCWATNCELPCGNYEFGSDGKMLQGIIEIDGSTYFYENGRLSTNPGLTKVGDDYYFVASNGKCATGAYYAWATNCELKCGNYEFGSDGKMLQGIVEKDGSTYFYVNGKLSSGNAGLTKISDDYYFVSTKGKCATGTYYCWATNCDLPCGTYEFGEDGKMLHGLITKEDGLYCYVYGKMGGTAGLFKFDDDYYFVTTSGKCVTGTYYCWATSCDLPIGSYEFGEDGKMLNGFVSRDDEIYYYVNGKLETVGLHYIDGYYYFVTYGGKLIRNQSYYVWQTNGLLLETTYTFDDLGRIIG